MVDYTEDYPVVLYGVRVSYNNYDGFANCGPITAHTPLARFSTIEKANNYVVRSELKNGRYSKKSVLADYDNYDIEDFSVTAIPENPEI